MRVETQQPDVAMGPVANSFLLPAFPLLRMASAFQAEGIVHSRPLTTFARIQVALRECVHDRGQNTGRGGC